LRLQALSQWKLKSFADVMWSFSADDGGHAAITALLPQLSLEWCWQSLCWETSALLL